MAGQADERFRRNKVESDMQAIPTVGTEEAFKYFIQEVC